MRSISKVFVAAAVAGACGYASAATLTVTGQSYTNNTFALEAAVAGAATNTVLIGTLNATIVGQYTDGDYLELDLSGANGISYGTAATNTASFTCTNGAGNTIVATLLTASSTATKLVYSFDVTGISDNQTCAIPSVYVNLGSVTGAGDIVITPRQRVALGGGQTVITRGTATKVGSIANRYSISAATLLDGEIDVQNNRLVFTGPAGTGFATDSTRSDTYGVSINVASADHTVLAQLTGTMTLALTASSDFNFLIDPAGSTCEVSSGTGQATAFIGGGASGSVTASTNCRVLTAVIPSFQVGVYKIGLGRTAAPTVANSTAFTEQTYTATAVARYTTAGGRTGNSKDLGSASAGAWTINGTTVNIPYYPINADINLITNISNRSNQSGAVTMVAWNAAGTRCPATGSTSLSAVPAFGNHSLGAEIKTALLACTGAGWTGATRATVQLVVPTPDTLTDVNTSFSANDGRSRQIVINSQNTKE